MSEDWLHPDLIVSTDGVVAGKGLVTTKDIPEGAVIWKAADNEDSRYYIPQAEVDTWTEEQKEAFFVHACMIGPGVWSGIRPGDELTASVYYNHSDNPNTWWNGDKEIVAMRDIKAGEEITYHYGTSELEGTHHGIVTGQEYKDEAFQKRFAGHCTSLVQKAIDEYNKQKGQSS